MSLVFSFKYLAFNYYTQPWENRDILNECMAQFPNPPLLIHHSS